MAIASRFIDGRPIPAFSNGNEYNLCDYFYFADGHVQAGCGQKLRRVALSYLRDNLPK